MAATCFVFAAHLDENQALCLRLNEQGQVDAPLQYRTLSDIRALQHHARTVIVIPTEHATLHEVSLPRLSERQARMAIPYALEEELAQPVTDVHVAFDKAYYRHGAYFVAVIDKAYFSELIATCDALNLDFDVMTLDFFALNDNEVCVTDRGILLHQSTFKGALDGEMAKHYLTHQKDAATAWFWFKDSVSLGGERSSIVEESDSSTWMAKRLLQAEMMNLCQGEFQHRAPSGSVKQWTIAAAILLGIWLTSMVLIKAFYVHSLSTKEVVIDEKIAVIYREFFPKATHVISPRFRINQLLATGSANADSVALWSLLDKWAVASKGYVLTVDEWRFQNKILSITLIAKNFAELEQLQQRLHEASVNVTQSEASSEAHQVKATLELRL